MEQKNESLTPLVFAFLNDLVHSQPLTPRSGFELLKQDILGALADIYRETIEATPLIIYMCTIEGTVVFISRNVSLMGYSVEETIGHPLSDFVHPDDVAAAMENIQHYIRTGTNKTGSFRLKAKDGSYEHFEEHSKILKLDEVPAYVLGVLRNISRRREAIEELLYRQNLERLIGTISRKLISVSEPLMEQEIGHALGEIAKCARVDRSYAYLSCEGEASRGSLIEWCREDIEPRRDKLRASPETTVIPWLKRLEKEEFLYFLRPVKGDKEAEALLAEEALKSILMVPINYGGELMGFVRFDSQDSAKEWVESEINLIKLVAEAIANALGRNRAEKLLRESRDYAYTLLVSTIAGMIIVDRETHRIIDVNPMAEKLIGRGKDEIIGEECHNFVCPAQKGQCPITDKGMTVDHSERTLLSVEQGKIPIIKTVVSLRHNDRDILVESFVDISHLKKTEEKLAASLKEKDVLIKEIHHRVKNNMQIISSLINLQLANVEDRRIIQMVDECRTRIHSMAFIHQKLYESGNLTSIEIAPYIEELTRELCRAYSIMPDQVRVSTKAENMDFDIERAINCGLILNELLSNAFKHAFPSGQRGEVAVELHHSDGGLCTLSVKDNGVGMPEDADAQKVESLGLQLIHMLAAQLDGSAEVRRNGGTEFVITFPVHSPPAS